MPTTEQTTATVTDADRAAVAGLTQRIMTAWGNHDADAFANVFTEDGTMILPGVFRKGRREIRTFMAAAFAGPYKGTQVVGQPFDVRFIGTDVSVLLTQGGVLAPGQTELPDERTVRASWLAVRRGGDWLLAAYQNSPRDN